MIKSFEAEFINFYSYRIYKKCNKVKIVTANLFNPSTNLASEVDLSYVRFAAIEAVSPNAKSVASYNDCVP